MTMGNEIQEKLNTDLYATIESTILDISNIKITWAAFGDRIYFDDEALNSAFRHSKDFELVNSINSYVKTYFDDNMADLDFSSYTTSSTSLHELSTSLCLAALDKNLDKLGSVRNGADCSYMFMAIQMLALREAAALAFNNGHYYTAMEFYKKLIDTLNLTVSINIYKRGEVSFSGKAKAKARWSKHNQSRTEKKKQYLEIMDKKNFATFSAAAEYIKQNIETDKTPSYDTIKRWLSQARKGDFS